MYKTFSNHQTVIATNLSVHPVFENGFVLYAHTNENGARVVSFENVGSIYSATDENGSMKAKQRLIFGYGDTTEQALRQALIGFKNNLTYNQMYPRWRSHPKGSAITSSKLDHWLFKHKGKLTAVRDVDGTIICHLEGYKQPDSTEISKVHCTGTGLNFRAALNDAFSKV